MHTISSLDNSKNTDSLRNTPKPDIDLSSGNGLKDTPNSNQDVEERKSVDPFNDFTSAIDRPSSPKEPFARESSPGKKG
jgi:hypothetical protein